MSYKIYEGFWTDWAKGRWLGATITLSQRNGALLLAFTATFITVVMTRFWRILSFSLHQAAATPGAHDALHYQRQHTLRNASSPAGAAKVFILQSWFWRGRQAAWKTLPWAVLTVAYICGTAALAVFSAKISDGATTLRLLSPEDCGIWRWEYLNISAELVAVMQKKVGYDLGVASSYARACYAIDTKSLGCQSAPVPKLLSISETAACPFQNNMCLDNQAFEVKTQAVDSRVDLGINSRDEDRILYDRQTICAPLVTDGYEQSLWDDVNHIDYYRYYYGSVQNTPGNWTLELYTRLNTTYSVYVITDDDGSWKPLADLSNHGGDTSLIVIRSNGVLHEGPNNDPIFRASIPVDTVDIGPNMTEVIYKADRASSPLACSLLQRYCTHKNQFCSPWSRSSDITNNLLTNSWGLNPRQRATAIRLHLASLRTDPYNILGPRPYFSLRAQEQMQWRYQSQLPDNQWEIEVLAWEHTRLALMQLAVQEYAAGSGLRGITNLSGQATRWLPRADTAPDSLMNSAWQDMCHDQIVRETQGTLNFSVLGLAVVLCTGTFVVLFSYVMEVVVSFLQRHFRRGMARSDAWQRDDSLQTVRLLFSSNGKGTWQGARDLIPTTETLDEVFFYPDESLGSVCENYEAVSKQSSVSSSEPMKKVRTY